MENPKKQNAKSEVKNDNSKTSAKSAEAVKSAPVAPVKVPPMFRKIDWLALVITFVSVWAVYLWTLAPELTLEDSGELCTGSYYAGIPHPPGYPFWAIWSWIWTVIVPIGNVAWRVEVGQSFASAFGCGLLALMVSRGGSMLIEGIEELKSVEKRWENAICAVSGVVAGMLLGLGFFMWHESVVINRISIFGVPWLLAMVALLMRWMYAPHQRWYLYLAMLFYGWIGTIHQSLILGAFGVEVLIAMILPKLGRDLFAVNALCYALILYFMDKGTVPALNAMTYTEKTIFNTVGIVSIIGALWLFLTTNKIFTEWKSVSLMGVMWAFGFAVYFYEPISCMTVPPMQWGYPRTVEGFFHALSRGQYGAGDPSSPFQDPGRFVFQLYYLAEGLSESFSWVYMFIGLLPFIFLKKMQARERGWIIGLTVLYLLLSVQLVVMLNVAPDRSTADLNKVFFTASHGLFAIMIGYGFVILAAYIATHYQKFRRVGIYGGVVALLLALYCLVEAVAKLYYGKAGQLHAGWLPFSKWSGWDFLALGPNGQFGLLDIPQKLAQAFSPDQYGLPVIANLILVAMTLVFIAALLFYKQRGPVTILLALFCVAPAWSAMSHWYKSEQRNHWFGYWFGHDMFTPPFKDPATGKLSYDNVRRTELLKDSKEGKLIYPEMARDTILFGGTDPGRFCPTYIIFCESIIPHRCQPEQDQKFDRRDVYIITQNALADGTYLDYLRSQYNRHLQIDPPFFSRLFKYVCAVGGLTPQGAIVMEGIDTGNGDSGSKFIEGVASLLDNTLDKWFRARGERIEAQRRAEKIYPPKEIQIPTPEESAECFEEYRRQKQLEVSDGHISVSGQVDVMNINGLLCKVIFDYNPTNEFYVEESFPLDWMYNYETPFGIIMKINRQPVYELTQDDFDRDHKFWSDFSTRLCGNFINYDTSVKEICDFAERTYVANNFKGYTGSPAFARDDDAQKAFSKLRSSQAGMYAWRCGTPGSGTPCPPEFRQKSKAAQDALLRETDFAFKQAFAFCPYSPEAVFRYANFLLGQGRFDDTILIFETCLKLDPFNDQVRGQLEQIKKYKEENAARVKAISQVDDMEKTARTDPNNLSNLVMLGGVKLQMQDTNRAIELFNQALDNPNLKFTEAAAIVQYYGMMANIAGFEKSLRKIVVLAPDAPEYRFNLADVEAITGRSTEALADLKMALDLNSKRLKSNPSAVNLVNTIRADPNLNSLRSLPEFQKLVPPQ
jgi:tetratricopeptide (TPR) repeat protein